MQHDCVQASDLRFQPEPAAFPRRPFCSRVYEQLALALSARFRMCLPPLETMLVPGLAGHPQYCIRRAEPMVQLLLAAQRLAR